MAEKQRAVHEAIAENRRIVREFDQERLEFDRYIRQVEQS
jgi:hypothetical protein